MAEETDPESKTEDPTPRRREEARRQGQVPVSSELIGSLVLLAGVVGLSSFGPDLWDGLVGVYRFELSQAADPDLTPVGAQELLRRTLARVLSAFAPFFAVLLAAGITASVVQVGFQVNTERLELNFDKLNPANGVEKLFSTSAAVRGGLAILKVIVLTGMAYWVIESRAGVVTGLSRDRLSGAAAGAWLVVTRLAVALTAAVAAVAVIDYFYQRRKFEQSLRMSKEELKQELKQEEGDPHIKARVRQIQRERARRRMLAEVPKATVVVTNPTHYAVALRYDRDRDDAPVVVAKGTGLLAKRIAELARGSSIPVVERSVLARALFATVREGSTIPGPMFQAVAEVLALVYRLRGINTNA